VDLSCIIVTYNSAGQIRGCLHSLLHNVSHLETQIILIDNNSTDDTLAAISSVTEGKSTSSVQISIIRNHENVGFTRALNQGLIQSSGSFLFILNPDTEVREGAIQTLLTLLGRGKKCGVAAPQLLNTNGTIQPSCRRFPHRNDILFELFGLSYLFPKSKRFNRWKMGAFDHRSARSVEQPQGACLLFPRSVLDKVGLWDESFPMFFSDVDWCKRVKEAGFDILFEPSATVIHHRGSSIRQRRAQMIWTSHRSFYTYFKKYERKFPVANEIYGSILWITAVARIVIFSLVGRWLHNSVR